MKTPRTAAIAAELLSAGAVDDLMRRIACLAAIAFQILAGEAQAVVVYERTSSHAIVVAGDDGSVPQVIAHGYTPVVAPDGEQVSWAVPQPPVSQGGPVLLDQRVAWIAPRSNGSRDFPPGDLYIARPGKSPHRVQAFPAEFESSPNNSPQYRFELAGSSSSIALLRNRFCYGFNACADRLDVFAGAAGSQLERVERCQGSTLSTVGIDVNAHLAAFPGCDGRLVLHDISGTKPDGRVGTDAHEAKLAGHYVAWIQYGGGPHSGDLFVYDRVKRAVAYSIPRRKLPTIARGLTLQRDGKVAFTFDPNPDDTDARLVVAWASPEEPRVHLLGLPARFAYFLRIAGDRIAFGRESAHPGSSSHPEVGITDLEGHSRLVTQKATGTTNIDFDGDRITYVERSNHQTKVRIKQSQ